MFIHGYDHIFDIRKGMSEEVDPIAALNAKVEALEAEKKELKKNLNKIKADR